MRDRRAFTTGILSRFAMERARTPRRRGRPSPHDITTSSAAVEASTSRVTAQLLGPRCWHIVPRARGAMGRVAGLLEVGLPSRH